MSSFKLDEELETTPFIQVSTVCYEILDQVGFKYDFSSWGFFNKHKVVYFTTRDDELHAMGNDWHLVFKEGGNVMQFFTDFLSHVAIKRGDCFVNQFS